MSEIIETLTSTEFIIIYLIAGISCLLCIIIYSIDSSKDKRRKKHNTRNLNHLVDNINDELDEYDIDYYDYNKVPELETISSVDYGTNLMNTIAPSKEKVINEKTNNSNIVEKMKEDSIIETMVQDSFKERNIPKEEIKPEKVHSPLMQEVKKLEDEEFDDKETINVKQELQYTSIEPNQEEAKRELEEITQKLKMDLIKQREQSKKPVIEEVRRNLQEEIKQYNSKNIDLTDFEQQQEENSIISLDELNTKGKKLYEANELTQYKDEGNEPISLKDLENKVLRQMKEIKDSFNIDKVADKPSQEEIDEMLEGTQPIVIPESKKVKMDDFNTVKSTYHPTPFISPIYGMEQNKKVSIENTADYDKLDDEINKTNEFVMSLKEFQENLD